MKQNKLLLILTLLSLASAQPNFSWGGEGEEGGGDTNITLEPSARSSERSLIDEEVTRIHEELNDPNKTAMSELNERFAGDKPVPEDRPVTYKRTISTLSDRPNEKRIEPLTPDRRLITKNPKIAPDTQPTETVTFTSDVQGQIQDIATDITDLQNKITNELKLDTLPVTNFLLGNLEDISSSLTELRKTGKVSKSELTNNLFSILNSYEDILTNLKSALDDKKIFIADKNLDAMQQRINGLHNSLSAWYRIKNSSPLEIAVFFGVLGLITFGITELIESHLL